MGDESIVIETTEAFLEDTPGSIKQMKAAYANEDWDRLARIAHKIKPNLSYMGMDRARELILDLEEQSKNREFADDFRQQIKELDQLCEQAFDELSEKVEQLKN